METIEVYPGTGKLIEKILSDLKEEQMKVNGMPITETPADLVSFLIGYYQGSQNHFKRS